MAMEITTRTLAFILLMSISQSFEGSSPGLRLRSPSPTRPTFRAAVYDKPPVLHPPGKHVLDREEALKVVLPVLYEYSIQAQRAANKKVNIIVFPEYGLYPMGLSRNALYPFLEQIPHPRTDWTPCLAAGHANMEIQRHLSCIARNNSMYVVANMGDAVPCDGCGCQEGRHQFNTNVVFDPAGKLIARYHKKNLFFEFGYDTPNTVDYSYFDTPFGRFGTFVCFDILFEDPAVNLIEQYAIDHVTFPTAWMNVLPYFSAVPFHQSFARGQGVNLLAANIHHPGNRFSGSGVYAGTGPVVFRNDDSSDMAELLIGDLQSKPTKVNRRSVQFGEDFHPLKPHFQGDVFGDIYNFVSLENHKDDIGVCHGDVCCRLTYDRDEGRSEGSERFVLGAFRGLHTKEGTYFIEVCAFMKCADDSESSCGSPVKRTQTYFRSFILTGNFTTSYVYPQVTSDLVDPAVGQWTYDGQAISSPGNGTGTTKPLLAAVFFARRYDLDSMRENVKFGRI